MDNPPVIAAETPADSAAVEALIAAAFGPGRLAKTAERLREGNAPLLSMSAVARQDADIIGCSRLWPIHIDGRPAVLLGPFAVASNRRSAGLGAAMIEWCCEQAKAAGHDLVLLVGDAAYFNRLGFVPAPDVRLPGPVNQKRVLMRPLRDGADRDVAGPVTL